MGRPKALLAAPFYRGYRWSSGVPARYVRFASINADQALPISLCMAQLRGFRYRRAMLNEIGVTIGRAGNQRGVLLTSQVCAQSDFSVTPGTPSASTMLAGMAALAE